VRGGMPQMHKRRQEPVDKHQPSAVSNAIGLRCPS
jgi:hypothetical protein